MRAPESIAYAMREALRAKRADACADAFERQALALPLLSDGAAFALRASDDWRRMARDARAEMRRALGGAR